MRRLLIVTTVPEALRAFLLPFAAHFREQGWRVDALARGAPDDPQVAEVFDRVWSVDWSRNPLDPRNLLRSPGRIRQLVASEGYDLVHVHTPVAAFVTRYALRRQDTPQVIYTAHGFHFYRGGPPIRSALFAGLEKIAGSWTDHLVVINREDEAAARRLRLVPPDRLHHMPGIGLDLGCYNAGAIPDCEVARVRRELGLASGESMLLMIAEFIPRKRHADTLRAFARLGRPDVRLVLAGTGPLVEPMERLVAELGLGARVHFLGFRQDVPALIQASVATLLPSTQEGLPRSIMESLCLGIPVIGSDIRGVRDLLGAGAGLLVKVGDIEALAGAMAHVLEHPEEGWAMGHRGREQVIAYDLPHILARHEELYAAALAECPAASSARRGETAAARS